MPTFVKSVLIDAPLETVFGFHQREDALALLTPSFPRVRVISRTAGIQAGSRVEFRVGLFSFTALHTAYEKDRLFVDEQIQGPFAKWIHRHEFEDVNGQTRLTDRVVYLLPGGPLSNFLFDWIVALGLNRVFDQRHCVTKRICENV